MSKDRSKPQFLDDTPDLADFIAERLKEIRKAEGRVAQEPGFVTQPVTDSHGGFLAQAIIDGIDFGHTPQNAAIGIPQPGYDPAYAASPQQAINHLRSLRRARGG